MSLHDRLAHASSKFLKACDQIKLIKERISELINMGSFDVADMERSGSTDLRKGIRMQIDNLQSVKAMYYVYAHQKADEITRLQCEIYGEDAVREAYNERAAEGPYGDNEPTVENYVGHPPPQQQPQMQLQMPNARSISQRQQQIEQDPINLNHMQA